MVHPKKQADVPKTAVLKEVLRCSNPLPGRLPRVVPSDGVFLNGNHLEAGVRAASNGVTEELD